MTTTNKNILFFIIFFLLNLQNKTFPVETKNLVEKENLIKNIDKIKIIAEETPIRSFFEEPGNDKKNDKKENKDQKSPENATPTISTTQKIVGSEIDIVSRIFNKLKIPFEIEIVHWTEMLPKMISGEADMAIGIEKNSKFDKYVNFTRTPTYTKNYSFYGLSSQLKDTFVMSFEDAVAHNYSVGILIGFSYPKVFWEAYPFENKQLNSHLFEGKNIRDNIIKLKERKIDLLIADRERTNIILKKIGADETIFQYKNILYWKEFFLVFSKKLKKEKYEMLKAKIDRELYKMTESEEINEINESWIKKGT